MSSFRALDLAGGAGAWPLICSARMTPMKPSATDFIAAHYTAASRGWWLGAGASYAGVFPPRRAEGSEPAASPQPPAPAPPTRRQKPKREPRRPPGRERPPPPRLGTPTEGAGEAAAPV